MRVDSFLLFSNSWNWICHWYIYIVWFFSIYFFWSSSSIVEDFILIFSHLFPKLEGKGKERHKNLAIGKFIEFLFFGVMSFFTLFICLFLASHAACWINVLSKTQHLWSIVNSWRIVWWKEFCFLFLSFAFCHFIVLWSNRKCLKHMSS